MEKVKVIFRKNSDGIIEAFFPETPVLFGNIMCYAHIGQHGEASLEYYHSTTKANEAEYTELLNELKRVYDDCILIVRQRINYDDLQKAWV